LLWRRIKDRQSENHFNVVETNCEMDCFISNQKIGKVLFWLTSQFGQLGQEKQEQAQEMHEFIRETVRKAFGSDIADLSFTAEA
jgi:triosephosphate isomerase